VAEYRVVDAARVEAQWGVFRKMRRALGGSAFGINQVELPPGARGREHDEGASGQEEVYVVLAGTGTLTVDGDDVALVPGRYVLVPPGATRVPTAGADGLTFVAVGAVPGAGYRPSDGL
jgi:quercetin dioxygenase-like cupin family protein